ncbi:MAG: TonB-dependent receptor [Burkholderiaceae bacterium]|nr:TonB-dependent receptor [Burkholderiaceae bacterium]
MSTAAAARQDFLPQADTDDLERLLNQPVYAASKYSEDAARAPAAVTVLTAGDIRAYGWRTLAEVLNAVRGVYLRYDRTYNYVGVRGFSRPGDYSSRLLMLIDGYRVNDNIYSQAAAGREFPLDVRLIERVEFIPGPGSSLYGSNAVLGVVNIVTKSAAALHGGLVTVELGSESSRLLSVTHGGQYGDASVVLSAKAEKRPGRDLFFPEYAGESPNFGRTPGQANDESDRKLYAKWTRGELTATAMLSERRKHTPTNAFGALLGGRFINTDRYSIADLQWQHELDADQQLYVRANVAQFQYTNNQENSDPLGSTLLVDQRGRWLGVEARWHHSGLPRQRLVLGVEAQRNFLQRQRASLVGVGAQPLADINGTSHRFGVFVNDEVTLWPRLRAVLGARVDRQLSGADTVSPRLGLLWDASPGLVVKLLDGRAFREPNAAESEYFDDLFAANSSLRSEKLRATELALDWRALPSLRLAASLYRYRVSEQIDQGVDPNTGLLTYHNVGASRARGVEVEGDYVAPSNWRVRGSWASQDASDKASGERLTNSPNSLSKLNISLPWPSLPVLVGIEWQRIGQRLTVSRQALPSHTVTNLTLRVNPPVSNWSLSGTVYNVFDKAFADSAGPEHDKPVALDKLARDGRQWRIQLVLRF